MVELRTHRRLHLVHHVVHVGDRLPLLLLLDHLLQQHEVLRGKLIRLISLTVGHLLNLHIGVIGQCLVYWLLNLLALIEALINPLVEFH